MQPTLQDFVTGANRSLSPPVARSVISRCTFHKSGSSLSGCGRRMGNQNSILRHSSTCNSVAHSSMTDESHDLKQLLAAHPCILLQSLLNRPAFADGVSHDERHEGSHRRRRVQLIFDGKTTKGWIRSSRALPASHVQDGALNPHPCNYMLVYEKPLT